MAGSWASRPGFSASENSSLSIVKYNAGRRCGHASTGHFASAPDLFEKQGLQRRPIQPRSCPAGFLHAAIAG